MCRSTPACAISTLVRRAVFREAGASRGHGDSIKATPETPQTSRHTVVSVYLMGFLTNSPIIPKRVGFEDKNRSVLPPRKDPLLAPLLPPTRAPRKHFSHKKDPFWKQSLQSSPINRAFPKIYLTGMVRAGLSARSVSFYVDGNDGY